MTEEQFEKILTILEDLKQNNYVNLSDVHYQLFEKAKTHAMQQYPSNEHPLQQLLSFTQTASQEQIEQNRKIESDGFNIDRFYTSLCDKLEISPIQSIGFKIEDRGSSPFVFKQTNELKDETNLRQAYTILDNLRKKNDFFDKSLSNKNVVIKILDDNSPDGRFIASDYKKSNGKDVVVTLNKGCFDEKNKALLPMIIAHEFGHFIDVSNRPLEYSGGLKDKEEFFADSIGYKMAVNAGYENSVHRYIDLLNNHKNNLNNERALKLRLIQAHNKSKSAPKQDESIIDNHSAKKTSFKIAYQQSQTISSLTIY